MSIGFVFWLLMLLWLFFGVYNRRGVINAPWIWGGDLLLYILLFLIGWRVFGWPIAG